MPRITWGNVADKARADIQSRIDDLARRASWDNIPTWNDLNNTVEMELMRRKSHWGNLGMTEEELLAEMMAEIRAAQQQKK